MKKVFYLPFLAFCAIFLASCENDQNDDSTVILKEIPVAIREYVSTHFPEQTVSQATLQNDDDGSTFELLLDNFVVLEFNADKALVEIDGQSKLPDSVFPEKVLAYVKQHYPDQFITNWELDVAFQQVELNNQTELEFDKEGTFLRIGD